MFDLVSDCAPAGDQPQAIAKLTEGILSGAKHQVLLGVTGSGKPGTIANHIARVNAPRSSFSITELQPRGTLFCGCCVDARSICCDALTMNMPVNREALGQFCRQRGIARLEVFGSALRDDFRADSDVDLLCSLRPEVKCGLFEWVALKLDLEKLFGRPVDLVSRPGIERSRNPYRRNAILKTAVPLYVEG